MCVNDLLLPQARTLLVLTAITVGRNFQYCCCGNDEMSFDPLQITFAHRDPIRSIRTCLFGREVTFLMGGDLTLLTSSYIVS